ncbi:5-(carboxyamino)imidazole ribonucleotide synthase [Jeotgalibaca sp. A122]|uniref:5-(carboxyamino)imidazole ribonucleotide synthase n=1 Tax=Jeotgalibaca sp. A122 TaxID=3457322 RepID=UPI003FD1881D
MSKTIYPNQTIGILGGGQLGKMLGQSAQKMGYRVGMYDEGKTACGFGVSHYTQVGSFNDQEKVMDFARSVDVLTYEFENINGEILTKLNDSTYLPQNTDFLLTTQNRLNEKKWLGENGIPCAAYMAVNTREDLIAALEKTGYPAILKRTRFGYDGKGQFKINNSSDLENLAELSKILEAECVLEAFYPFEYETSVVVARDVFGTVACFPPVVNQHVAGILFTSVTSSTIPEAVQNKMIAIAEKIAHSSELIGVCGIEFFVSGDGEVVVNELAPRPHNTGHYTIEGTNVSQFDQHILAITGRPIIPVRLLTPTLMVNILGQHIAEIPELIKHFPEAIIHLYDKGEPRHQRKMGHFILMDEAVEKLERLVESDSLLKRWRDAIKMEEN